MPDVGVFGPRQEEDVGVGRGPAGPADLLVVGDRRAGRAQVDDEAEVGLVEAHAEGRRGDQGLDPVGLERGLGRLAFGVVRPARVGPDGVARPRQVGGRVLGPGHGQAVDDPGALEVAQVLGQPGQPLRVRPDGEHAEAERRPGEGPADRDDAVAARRQLFLDVGHDPGVGRGRRRQDRHVRRQAGPEIPEAAVVGPEIVAPVGDAVGLVDHDEAGRARQQR